MEEKDALRPDEPSRTEFKNDLDIIKSLFNVLSVPNAAQRLVDGTLPARAACITFDDGYLNNHEIAAPMLEEAGLPATFYIATGAIESGIMWNDLVIETFARSRHTPKFTGAKLKKNSEQSSGYAAVNNVISAIKYKPLNERWQLAQEFYTANTSDAVPRLMMTPDRIQDLSKRGFDIGGHTVNHPILAEMSDEDAANEIKNSIAWLAEVTGKRAYSFAYPNGKPGVDYNERHSQMVAGAGCKAAFSTTWGVGKSSSSQYEIPRIGPWWRTGRSVSTGLLRLYLGSYAR
ncbi:MAG: polysaccharide deacetylase family protein [Pseudomonadota bacterium]